MNNELEQTYDKLRDLLCKRYAAIETGLLSKAEITVSDAEIKQLCLVVAGSVIKDLCDQTRPTRTSQAKPSLAKRVLGGF